MKPSILICCVAAIGLLAGCGGGTKHPSGASKAGSPTPTHRDAPDSRAALARGVRSAVQRNARLSSYVLWKNVVPSWAGQSTSGPALRGLRSSAAGRRARSLRVRTLSHRVAILRVTLDPSYLSATARVRESGKVVPYRNGRRLGRSIALNEVAYVELHRAARTSRRFVVWKVTSAR